MLARRAIIGRCYPKSDVCPASHNKAAKRVQFPYPHLPNGSAGCITPGLLTWDQPRSMAVSICRDSCTLLREARANTSNGLCSPTTSQGGYSHKKLALRARCNLPNIRRVSLGLACQSGLVWLSLFGPTQNVCAPRPPEPRVYASKPASETNAPAPKQLAAGKTLV